MGDQYCDTESDQKACNNRPHERSPRHHRLRRREPAQSKRISNIGGNCLALMISSNRKGTVPRLSKLATSGTKANGPQTNHSGSCSGCSPRRRHGGGPGGRHCLRGRPLLGVRGLAPITLIPMMFFGRDKLTGVARFATSQSCGSGVVTSSLTCQRCFDVAALALLDASRH
jgi:hypothetical protein